MVKKIKRKPGQKEPVIPLLVSTSSGNTFMSSDSKVLVHVGGETYYQKKASELKPGDMVLYEIEFTTKDYDPTLLLGDENFRKARDVIHTTDGQKHIPKLRDLLLRGLTSQDVIHTPDLESRIFMDPSDDFSRSEYRKMEDHIHALLISSARSKAELRSREAINNWLTGETLAPSEWEIFHHLSSLHPGFADIHHSFEQPEGFHASYLVYTITSRSVARYFAQPKDPASLKPEDSGEYSRRGLVSIRPIVEHILRNHFGDCIDTKYRPSIVRSVERLEPSPRDDPKKAEHPDPHLRRGVYVIDETPPDVHKIGLRELFEDYMVVEKAVLDSISTYLNNALHLGTSFALGTMNYNVTHKVMYGLIPHDQHNDYWYKAVILPASNEESAHQFADQAREAITTGKADLELGVEPFSLMEAIKTFNHLSRQVPNGFKAWWRVRNKRNELKLSESHQRDLDAQVRKLYQTHVKQHGIPEHYLGIADVSVYTDSLVDNSIAIKIQGKLDQQMTKLTPAKADEVLSRYGHQALRPYVSFAGNVLGEYQVRRL